MSFITFEGPEGSGKSTQIKLLKEKLIELGYRVVTTREPGGTEIAELIRSVIFQTEVKEALLPLTDAFLFQAARHDHVERFIKPHLEQGYIVLCDRFSDSTLAYQAFGNNLDFSKIQQICNLATNGLWPDLTILLNLPVQMGIKRKIDQLNLGFKEEWNRIDEADLSFHERVYQGYMELAKRDPQRWVVVDATKDITEIYKLILNKILNCIKT